MVTEHFQKLVNPTFIAKLHTMSRVDSTPHGWCAAA